MAILDNLSYCLEADESSGSMIDAHSGGRDFSVTNSPGAATGKISGCRTFVAGSAQYASRADEAALEPGAAFTFMCWLKQPSSVAGDQNIWQKWAGGGPILETKASDGANLKMFHTGSGSDLITTSGLGMVADTWYHVAVVYDGSGSTDADKVKIYVDASSQSLTFAGAPVGSSFADIGVAQTLCYWPTVARFGSFHLDQVCFWQRALSGAEVATIYASGSGLAYPFSGGSAIKTINGLGIASVKTRNGLAIASVKTINGLA